MFAGSLWGFVHFHQEVLPGRVPGAPVLMRFSLAARRSTENPDEGTRHEFILLPKREEGRKKEKGEAFLLDLS